jgi:TnpA family transposase
VKADNRTTISIGEDMLKFEINLHVKEKIRAKCARHPRYDPSLDQRLHFGSGCTACTDIRNLHAARVALEDAARAFERRAYQWRIARVAKSKEGISLD